MEDLKFLIDGLIEIFNFRDGGWRYLVMWVIGSRSRLPKIFLKNLKKAIDKLNLCGIIISRINPNKDGILKWQKETLCKRGLFPMFSAV